MRPQNGNVVPVLGVAELNGLVACGAVDLVAVNPSRLGLRLPDVLN